MTAVRAILEPKTLRSSRRTATRRKLRLEAQGAVASGSTGVLILDLSTTGILLDTAGDLAQGETIELDIPETAGVRAVVKWSSGRLFGCEFEAPISLAAVSAAQLRTPYSPPHPPEFPESAAAGQVPVDPAEDQRAPGELSFAAKMRWILGLAFVSWAGIFAALYIAWGQLP